MDEDEVGAKVDDLRADDSSPRGALPLPASPPAPSPGVPPVALVEIRHRGEFTLKSADPAGSCRAFVGRIGRGTTRQHLAALVAQAGPVHEVQWPPWAKGKEAIVIYCTEEAANRAAATLDGSLVEGSKNPLSVRSSAGME